MSSTSTYWRYSTMKNTQYFVPLNRQGVVFRDVFELH